MKKVGIYEIINTVNGKIYVGQSINIYDRWTQHKYKSIYSEELGYNSAIHAAMRKYGFENFVFKIIEECEPELLDERERYWIEKLNSLTPNGYNIMPGGQKNKRIIHRCCDCGAIISKGAKRCEKCAHKNQERAKNPFKPLELAKEIKEKGFEALGKEYGYTNGRPIKKWCKQLGLPVYKEEIIKWYDEQMGIKPPEKVQKKNKERPVYKIDLQTGEILEVFSSIAEAARSIGKKKGNHITEVCKGKFLSAYGYGWRYVE